MPRDTIALTISDLSAFARTLRRDLATADSFPGHLALMNMLARAAGYGNFQHLRATPDPQTRAMPDPVPQTDRKISRCRLARLRCRGLHDALADPDSGAKTLRLGAAVAPAVATGDDRTEVNGTIDAWHSFGDRADSCAARSSSMALPPAPRTAASIAASNASRLSRCWRC